MHNLPVDWRLATSALLLLLHAGHHVIRAQNDTVIEVNSTLVLERTVMVNPSTKVQWGEKATIKCNLKVVASLSLSVYHLWLYQKSLPVRMAAFHPQSKYPGDYPREIVAHPDGPRCHENRTQDCSGRNITARGSTINNQDGTYGYVLEVNFAETICCDNDEFYCWFFIFSDHLPPTGFNSTNSANLSIDCNPKILQRRCYQPVTTPPPTNP